MPDDVLPLRPADRRDLLQSLFYALRFNRRLGKQDRDDLIARLAAEQVLEHLERSNYVVMHRVRPPGHPRSASPSTRTLPDDVAREAETIAAGWWWNAHGDFMPDRLVLLVQELQRWCLIASSHYAVSGIA